MVNACTSKPAALLALAVAFATMALPLRAELPDYKLGEVAQDDVITPVTLNVINPAATEDLKRREASRVQVVIRLDTNVVDEAETALRAAFYSARTNFDDAYYRTMKGKPESERVVGGALFDQAVMSARRRAGNFPLLEQLAPTWARNGSDEVTQSILVRQLREAMSHPIIAGRVEGFSSRNSVRVMAVNDLEVDLDPKQVEQKGVVTRGEEVLRLTDARSQVRTNIFAQLKVAGSYVASFVRTNAMIDAELTRVMRTQRTEGLAVMDNYDAGQTLVRRGQTIDARAVAALAALREKNAIAALQTKLAVQQATAPPPQPPAYLLWGIGAFGLILGLLLVILRRVRTTNTTLLPALAREGANLNEGEVVWRERALLAEASAEQAKQAMKSGFMQWMREKLVSGLFQQRAQLLSSQQKAEAEMRALDERLEQLHAPLQERIGAYEKRITELEKELAVKGEENRELIKAKISLAKHQLSVERERSRAGFGTN